MAQKRRRRKKTKPQGRAAVFFLVLLICIAAGALYLKNQGDTTPVSADGTQSPGQTDAGILQQPESSPSYPADAKFITADRDEIYKGMLILVNAEQKYHFPDNMDEMDDLYDRKTSYYEVSDSELYLNRTVIDALNGMIDDFYQAKGKNDLLIASAYRSFDHQKRLFDRKVDELGETDALTWVSRPGYSEHHTGLAIDLSVYNVRTGVTYHYDGEGIYAWINDNSYRYGFVVRYDVKKSDITGVSHEPWHFRYVGIPHGLIMQEKDYCMEEYLDYLKGFSFASPLKYEAEGGGKYEIYYVAAEQGQTKIPVPEAGTYEISGNNSDGFIVTVSK